MMTETIIVVKERRRNEVPEFLLTSKKDENKDN